MEKATNMPVEIDWFEWKQGDRVRYAELKVWVESFGKRFEEVFDTSEKYLRLINPDYFLIFVPNNYIIVRSQENDFYIYNPEIFELTYIKD